MKALWRSDLGQGKHDPLEIVSVVTPTGSVISAALIVPLDPHAQPIRIVDTTPRTSHFEHVGQSEEVTGLLEVIQAQMEAIDELSKPKPGKKLEGDEAKELAHLQDWAEQFVDMVEDLCVAMGLPRNPVGPTGIPELDKIVSLMR